MPPPRLRRLVQLFAGLGLYGVSASMLLLARLGVDPWDVLHQGLSRRVGLGVGTWAIIVGGAVLLLWIPLRERPGFGTIANVVVVGVVVDATSRASPPPTRPRSRSRSLVGGIVLNGVATGPTSAPGSAPARVTG